MTQDELIHQLGVLLLSLEYTANPIKVEFEYDDPSP